MDLWLEHNKENVNNKHHILWLKCIDFGDLYNSYKKKFCFMVVWFLVVVFIYIHTHTYIYKIKWVCLCVYAKKISNVENDEIERK